jgi:hypothetical protein
VKIETEQIRSVLAAEVIKRDVMEGEVGRAHSACSSPSSVSSASRRSMLALQNCS